MQKLSSKTNYDNNSIQVVTMKRYLLAAALMTLAANVPANQWSGNVNFLLGAKVLEESEWAPVDEHAAFGVLIDFKQKQWPVSIAIDLLGSYSEETELGVKFEGTTSEFDLGVRKIWDVQGSSIRPYVGGGLALVSGEFKGIGFTTASQDDDGTGIWLNGGIYWTLGPHFNLGLDFRVSTADVTLFGVEVDAGGTSGGLLLGYHW